jgi:hypothetical protein
MLARIAIIAMTTSNSIKVKPVFRCGHRLVGANRFRVSHKFASFRRDKVSRGEEKMKTQTQKKMTLSPTSMRLRGAPVLGDTRGSSEIRAGMEGQNSILAVREGRMIMDASASTQETG